MHKKSAKSMKKVDYIAKHGGGGISEAMPKDKNPGKSKKGK